MIFDIFRREPVFRMALILTVIFLSQVARGDDGVSTFRDIDMAKSYCDNAPLQDIEGIWHYVEDDVKVLVKKRDFSENEFDMIVVETPDCRLLPGDVIGKVLASVDDSKFRLQVFTARKGNILTDMRECEAKLSGEKDILEIKPRKLKFRFRSLYILPRFWRMINVSVDDPAGKLPKGVVKIYPSYDGNEGSARRKVRYL